MQQASKTPDGSYYIKPLVEWEDFILEVERVEKRREEARRRGASHRPSVSDSR